MSACDKMSHLKNKTKKIRTESQRNIPQIEIYQKSLSHSSVVAIFIIKKKY